MLETEKVEENKRNEWIREEEKSQITQTATNR